MRRKPPPPPPRKSPSSQATATDSDSESTPPRREREENGDKIDVDVHDAAAAAAANKLGGLFRATSAKKTFLSSAAAAKASDSGSRPAAKRAHGKTRNGDKKYSFKNTAAALGKSAALASGVLASRPEDGVSTRPGPGPGHARHSRRSVPAASVPRHAGGHRRSIRGGGRDDRERAQRSRRRQERIGDGREKRRGVGLERDATRGGERPAGEMLYTDFVIKLEAAMAKGESVNEPWVRWMVPLHLQYHRYASLQARRQKAAHPV